MRHRSHRNLMLEVDGRLECESRKRLAYVFAASPYYGFSDSLLQIHFNGN